MTQVFLISDGYKGSPYNICRLAGKYYAIHQQEGPFDMEKVKNGRLAFKTFEADSLKEVENKLSQYLNLDSGSKQEGNSSDDLVEPAMLISEISPDDNFLSYLFNNKMENIVRALSLAVSKLGKDVFIIGHEEIARELNHAIQSKNITAKYFPWNFGQPVDAPLVTNKLYIFCLFPKSDEEWRQFNEWSEILSENLFSIWELALPFATITTLQNVFDYNCPSFEQISDYYSGASFHAPAAAKLNELISFQGKTVIEFGPSDGNHTGLIVKYGAEKIVCVEARPENIIKLLAAKFAMKWDHVEILAQNFHSIHVSKYGRFDIAYAHGVYYHTDSPLHFLETLCELSDNIFIGGWCASVKNPRGEPREWSYKGETYKGEIYFEPHHFLSGVQSKSVYLEADSLKRFFTIRNFKVEEISREFPDEVTGDFFRILCTKK